MIDSIILFSIWNFISYLFSPANAPDSPTSFKKDLIRYMMVYKFPELNPWIDCLKEHNFSDCKYGFSNIFFQPYFLYILTSHDWLTYYSALLVTSVPGYHTGPAMHQFGHMKVRSCLSSNIPSSSDWKKVNGTGPLIIQCSSIGMWLKS